jgi:GxxExxY protein
VKSIYGNTSHALFDQDLPFSIKFYEEPFVIVDTKVVTSFNDSHLAQMLGYLNITGLKTALLLNFKYSRLQIKRISN